MILFSTNNFFPILIDFSTACAFVNQYHRHCKAKGGSRNSLQRSNVFNVGVYKNGVLVGVAICCYPVSRRYNGKNFLEVRRLCTNGTKNACSKLYAYCKRHAKIRGYNRLITYTLMSECGASLKASGFVLEAENVGGLSWSSNKKFVCASGELKKRWAIEIQNL